MKATATAPANIALIKYWGKADGGLNLPLSDTVSMNLSAAQTETMVEFLEELSSDSVELNGVALVDEELAKVSKHLDLLRDKAGVALFSRVKTKNTFPTGAGIASSASGFAALTVAASNALGLELTEAEMSSVARKGSGSACRSIPNGFVLWHKGESDATSFAESIYPENYWDIHDLIVVADTNKKKDASSYGHKLAPTSPLFAGKLGYLPAATQELLLALKNKDFQKFGECIELEALCMHAVMMTSTPSIFYWVPTTIAVLDAVKQLRADGLPAYFTIDAGPNVHVFCQAADSETIKAKLEQVSGVKMVIDSMASAGAKFGVLE